MSSLLQVSNLSKEYAGKKIFTGLSFSVEKRQKIGVIGRNGAGKSTLFRILVGDETALNGQIMIGKETRLGWLKQDNDTEGEETSLEYLTRRSKAQEWTIKKMASKFRFDDDRLSMLARGLSGGWTMRLKLTAMLLSEPNLFLLDEPTNYLDLETQILLEEYLKSYKGSFLIISHDREFLKKTCEETIEISENGCYHYPGKIENYLAFKEEKLSTAAKANKGLEQQQKHLQEFVDRFRYKASKAKQAQSFVKKINKLEKKRIAIEHQAGLTRIIIPPVEKRHNFALKIKNMSIGYNGKAVVDDINFDCRFGEKLAILGLNGQGKTTLLKTLAGTLEPVNGSFRWGSDIRLAYHGPDPISAMNEQEQIEAYLDRMAGGKHKNETILKMAANFLFRGHDIKKSIGILSGGERSRLLLAGILLSNPDVLLLDEPTCHLDFETVEALGNAIHGFKGTVLFASHDRTFSSLIATSLVEIKDGQAKVRLEDYQDYVEKLEEEITNKTKEAGKKEEKPQTTKEDFLKQKENNKKMKQIEKQLERLNTRQLELLEYFLENPINYDPNKAEELNKVKETIVDKEEEWLSLN